jgi:hypothetical protein
MKTAQDQLRDAFDLVPNGSALLPEVIAGVRFTDGVKAVAA